MHKTSDFHGVVSDVFCGPPAESLFEQRASETRWLCAAITWDLTEMTLLPLLLNAGKLLSRSPISKKNDVVTYGSGSPATHQTHQRIKWGGVLNHYESLKPPTCNLPTVAAQIRRERISRCSRSVWLSVDSWTGPQGPKAGRASSHPKGSGRTASERAAHLPANLTILITSCPSHANIPTSKM